MRHARGYHTANKINHTTLR